MDVITNPNTPLVAPVPRAFSIGNGVRIFGVLGNFNAQKFNIRLQCSDELLDPTEVAIDILVNLAEGIVTINSRRSGEWDDAQNIPNVPIRNNQKFEILIKCDTSLYKVFINTRYYCGLPQRIPFDFITHISILGDVSIEKICFEEESLAIETPPPSYDEAQARTYASQNLDADPLLQPTPGRPPYPSEDTNPLFRPTVNGNAASSETYYNPYQTETVSGAPNSSLNAASPNFRPVQKSNTKRYIQVFLIVLFLLFVIALSSLLGSSKSRHNH